MIVLYTDFGLEGPYTGQLQAVLYRLAPRVPVISLFADLPAFDIEGAAYLLAAYSNGFPPGTVFLCVVDPGVGSDRQAVIIEADGRWFVGPNEGLFAIVARRTRELRVWELPVPESAAATFHGRDVFAPAAARVARGAGVAGHELDASCLARTEWPDELWRVAYIDRYGNAITGVRALAVADDARLLVNGHLTRRARTFTEMEVGCGYWYGNSNGLVEFAANRARADVVLGAGVGTPVMVQV